MPLDVISYSLAKKLRKLHAEYTREGIFRYTPSLLFDGGVSPPQLLLNKEEVTNAVILLLADNDALYVYEESDDLASANKPEGFDNAFDHDDGTSVETTSSGQKFVIDLGEVLDLFMYAKVWAYTASLNYSTGSAAQYSVDGSTWNNIASVSVKGTSKTATGFVRASARYLRWYASIGDASGKARLYTLEAFNVNAPRKKVLGQSPEVLKPSGKIWVIAEGSITSARIFKVELSPMNIEPHITKGNEAYI